MDGLRDLPRRSVVFIPARISSATTAATAWGGGKSLLVFWKDGPRGELRAWRVSPGASGSTPHSVPLRLSGDDTRSLRPGFQAVAAPPDDVIDASRPGGDQGGAQLSASRPGSDEDKGGAQPSGGYDAGGWVYLLGGCDPEEQDQPDAIDVFRVRISNAPVGGGGPGSGEAKGGGGDVGTNVAERVACVGEQVPSPRRDFAVAVHGPYLYTFGGKAIVPTVLPPGGSYRPRYRDSDGLYRLDLRDHSWALVKGQCIEGVDEDESDPGPRAGCLYAQDDVSDSLYVMGGHRVGHEDGEAMDLRSQVYRLDLQRLTWQRLHNRGRTPDPRDMYESSALIWKGTIYLPGPRQCHALRLDPPPLPSGGGGDSKSDGGGGGGGGGGGCGPPPPAAGQWSMLPGSVSTRGRALYGCAWLQQQGGGGNSDCGAEALFYSIVEAHGPMEGEPQPADRGSLEWKVYCLTLVGGTDGGGSAAGSATRTYTAEQQPAADRLLMARAKEEEAFSKWEEEQREEAASSDERTRLRRRLPVKVMSFGKLKGQLVWELPQEYVDWMGLQPGFFNCRRALLYSLKCLGLLRHYTDEAGRLVSISGLGSQRSLDLKMAGVRGV